MRLRTKEIHCEIFVKRKQHVWKPHQCRLWLVMTLRNSRAALEKRQVKQSKGNWFSLIISAPAISALRSFPLLLTKTENTHSPGWKEGCCCCFYKLINSALKHSPRLWPLVLLSHVCLSFWKKLHLRTFVQSRAPEDFCWALQQNCQSQWLQSQSVTNL